MQKPLSLLILLGCLSCFAQEKHSNEKLISFVNPFIGTGGHGHTYPGATMPFGMMQLSLDTNLIDGMDVSVIRVTNISMVSHTLTKKNTNHD